MAPSDPSRLSQFHPTIAAVKFASPMIAPIVGSVSPPAWDPKGVAALRQVGSGTTDAFRHLMTPGGVGGWHRHEWQIDRQALASFQGWHPEGHCLDVAGHDWLWVLERQATEGLAHHLDSPSRERRLARCLAFLRSLDPTNGQEWPAALDEAQVYAEKPVRGRGRKVSAGRIDLLLAAKRAGETFGVVVEAKFGHDLSRNPLPAYHAAAVQLGLDGRNCRFVVLAVQSDPTIRARLKRNTAWAFQSWRRLLSNFERELPRQFDDDDFRRFRRTLFDRTS